jgi:2-polyprenyl-3-methyl-5-hydroxy-6-metoxy-1,4-benzoquinol methylase
MSEPAGAGAPVFAAPENAGGADFSRREFALRELMDEPCTFAEYRRAALDLEQVNRLTGGCRPTLRFMERVLAGRKVGCEPLHVVDVGCAQGAMLREIQCWAARRSVPLRLTGVDMNPYAARLARECDRREHVAAKSIAWLTADAFAIQLEHPADVVLSSLFTHHLSDPDVVRFLCWSEATAQVGWFVNDLERSERAARWFARLAWVMRWDRMVVADGPVSFRRAFVEADWVAYLREAGVMGAGVFGVRPGRLCVEKLVEL